MTCIVGLVDDGKVKMGGDSCGADPHSWQHVGNVKIFHNGDLLIGCAGSFRAIDILRYSVPGVKKNEENNDRFIRTSFIPQVIQAFSEAGLAEKGGLSDSAYSEFLIGYKGRLFLVQSDFSVLEAPDWGFAIGSGGDVARGSLYTTAQMGLTAERRITLALEAAEAVVVSVRSPFKILNEPE